MYNHKEAFALMHYLDEVTGDIEVLWNSRDGVTPFVISSRAGNPASHIDIDRDRCVPDHTPAVGARVFVDLTMERARVHRTLFVEKWWDREVHGMKMSDRWASKDAAIEDLARSDIFPTPGIPVGVPYGAPDVVTVDEAFLVALRNGRNPPVWTAVSMVLPEGVELAAGHYRAPDGQEGIIRGYDVLACCYTFEPDGFVPPAIIGPGIPDGRVQFGLEKAHLYVRIGDLPELRRSATIDFKGTP